MTYRCMILCGVISAVYIKLRQPPDSDLLYVRHKVIWDTLRILTKPPTLVGTHRVKIP